MNVSDENLTIFFIYYMFLRWGVSTDTFHAHSLFVMSFLQLMGRDPHVGPPSPSDLIKWSQEIVDKYSIKKRKKIVFTPCDGSTKDKRNKRGRKYWVVESNDVEYPLGIKVRRDRVNELMGEDNQHRACIRVGFGECPTWCPHCNTIWRKIKNMHEKWRRYYEKNSKQVCK